MSHSPCVNKCISIYNKTHKERQSFPTLHECFQYYQDLHKEYIQLIEEIRIKHAVEDANHFATNCLTFYTIHPTTHEIEFSYAHAYIFWNCVSLECDCIKLSLLLIPILLFQKVLFYNLSDAEQKYKSFLSFRNILKNIYEIVLKGDKMSTKCAYFNTLVSNTLTKIKRMEETIHTKSNRD